MKVPVTQGSKFRMLEYLSCPHWLPVVRYLPEARQWLAHPERYLYYAENWKGESLLGPCEIYAREGIGYITTEGEVYAPGYQYENYTDSYPTRCSISWSRSLLIVWHSNGSYWTYNPL
jgi:hypothetical protein